MLKLNVSFIGKNKKCKTKYALLKKLFLIEDKDINCVREIAGKSVSRICGFILYTRANAFVAKVMKDEEL